MSCPPSAITVYPGDGVRATITWTNQTSETLVCDLVFYIGYLQDSTFYYINKGYLTGVSIGGNQTRTDYIDSIYAFSQEQVRSEPYDLFVVVGKGYDPDTESMSEIYDRLYCEGVLYVSSG